MADRKTRPAFGATDDGEGWVASPVVAPGSTPQPSLEDLLRAILADTSAYPWHTAIRNTLALVAPGIGETPHPPTSRDVWLLERASEDGGHPTYWRGPVCKTEDGLHAVTRDPWDACWFARQQDVARVAVHLFGSPIQRSGWRWVEHSFRFGPAGVVPPHASQPDERK